MALIGQIRKNSWLLVVTIGLALAAFVIMDMTSSQNMTGGNQFTMVEVNGQEVDYREFQEAEQVLYSGGATDIYAQRDYLYNFFVERALIEDEAEELGLGVSKTELIELQFGSNLSPVIVQRFSDPNTRQVNRTQLNNIRQQIETGQMDPNTRRFWSIQEKEIIKDRLQTKINNLVSKGLYTPTWMAEQISNYQNATINVDVLKIPFAEIDDSEVEVTDEDIRAYLEEHRNEYALDEPTRTVSYVSFRVEPTSEDSMAIMEDMKEMKARFQNARNDSSFVANQYGTANQVYFKGENLSPKIADTAFKAEAGTVIGPYIDQGMYRLAKVIDRMVVPDSVASRHILRPVNTTQELQRASSLLDSIKTEINAGRMTFEEAARQYGTDGTAAQGGDLGMSAPGRMVKPFNDLLFYRADTGKLYIIGTQFGLHLVEATEKVYETNEEGVKIYYISEDIVPSEKTQNEVHERVLEFVGDNRDLETLQATVNNTDGLELQVSDPLKRNDHTITGLGSNNTSRDIVRWAFDGSTELGEVSPEVYVFKHPTLYYDEQYVVAALSSVSEGPLPSVLSMRDRLAPLVRNDKKAEMLTERISGMSMQQAADEFGAEIQQGLDVVFTQSFIPGVGNEPKVIGVAASLQEGAVSQPVKGAGGVYLVKLNSMAQPGPVSDLAMIRRSTGTSKKNQLTFELWDAWKDNAKIDDNRHRFY